MILVISGGGMIARVWRGATRAADGNAYLEYLDRTGHAEYRRIAGHRRTITLRRIDDERARFVVLSFWDSLDAIRAFAGADVERAVFYPEDDRYLVEREDRVAHFDVVFEDSERP
jgi:heme-degrading monooxygenase HmoA